MDDTHTSEEFYCWAEYELGNHRNWHEVLNHQIVYYGFTIGNVHDEGNAIKMAKIAIEAAKDKLSARWRNIKKFTPPINTWIWIFDIETKAIAIASLRNDHADIMSDTGEWLYEYFAVGEDSGQRARWFYNDRSYRGNCLSPTHWAEIVV
jgi:hypothetical protein